MLKHSKQRDLIYSYLKNTKAHPSAECIHSDLKAELPNLSLATVYRNLNLLTDRHMVQKLDTGSNEIHYDADMSEHAHFICKKCGCIKDVYEKLIDNETVAKALGEGNTVSLCRILIYGECDKCRQA